jgi:hypothetical protein
MCDTPVKMGWRLEKSFERYLLSEGNENIRNIVIEVAKQWNFQKNPIYEVLRCILNSFKAMNATRQNGWKGGPPRHHLLRVGAGGKTPNTKWKCSNLFCPCSAFSSAKPKKVSED